MIETFVVAEPRDAKSFGGFGCVKIAGPRFLGKQTWLVETG